MATRQLWFAALAMLALGSCQSRVNATRPLAPPAKAPRPAPAAAESIVVSIVGTNDFHGYLRRLPVLAGFIENLRRARRADGGVLLVDAGDMFQGTLASNLAEGAPVVRGYNALGYAAAALGNHEFDFGPVGIEPAGQAATQADNPFGAIEARVAQARFPVLSANLVEQKTGKTPDWRGLEPSAMVRVAGVRIGLVGVLTRETPHIVMPAYFRGLRVRPLAASIVPRAKKLRAEGAKLVVVLAHAGGDCTDVGHPHDLSSCKPDEEIFKAARKLPKGLVDVIVAGHTHKGVAQYVNGIAVVEAYAYGTAFSRVDVRFDPATHEPLVSHIFRPKRVCSDFKSIEHCDAGDYAGSPVEPDPRIARIIQPALDRAAQRRAERVGVLLKRAIVRNTKVESPLGNLFAELMLEAAPGADVAITNGGSLRANLPAGQLTYGELFEAMPFDNRLATLRMTGAELRRVLSRHLASDAHGIVSVAGMRVVAECTQKGLDVRLLRPDGSAIGDSAKLTVATSDYLVTGGDDLFTGLELPPTDVHADLGVTVRDALARMLHKHGIIEGGKSLYDPAHPRLELPGSRPVHCR